MRQAARARAKGQEAGSRGKVTGSKAQEPGLAPDTAKSYWTL